MNDTTLHIHEVVHELTIIGGNSPEVLKTTVEPVIEILEVIAQGPPGRDGIDGINGLQAVVDDPDPHLGGDLIMNSFQIKGQAETTELVIDGGLL